MLPLSLDFLIVGNQRLGRRPEDEADINETGQTALCPRCGIDSVLGSASGYPINREFLQKMNEYWFQRTIIFEQGSAERRGKPRA
jgi:hypothetical protein